MFEMSRGKGRRGRTWGVGSPEIALATLGASPSSMSQRVIRLFSWVSCQEFKTKKKYKKIR